MAQRPGAEPETASVGPQTLRAPAGARTGRMLALGRCARGASVLSGSPVLGDALDQIDVIPRSREGPTTVRAGSAFTLSENTF